VAYAVRAFAANAGIMITASHNPPEYNGYKLYSEHGVQVIAPMDEGVARRMTLIGPAKDIPLGDLTHQEAIGPDIASRYLAEIRSELPRVVADRKLRIVYTPLHGVGASVVERLFAEAGYADFQSVPEQREPNGHFPTVPFPNPEEPGALDLALGLALQTKADLLIANDPDVDRLAIAVPTPSGRWLPLSGNQIGLLLADFALAHGDAGTRALVLSSLVSSPMLESIAARYGARCERVLTGFKWVWTAALALEAQSYRYCFGYEEALGYSFGRAVRDKDGISAAVLVCDLVATLKQRRRSVLDALDDLARRFGVHSGAAVSRPVSDADQAAALMRRLRATPPDRLIGFEVTTTDLPPRTDALIFTGGNADTTARVVVRPSGTEPKVKFYIEVRSGDRARADALRDALTAAVRRW
jgi:phosphomannomutase